MILVGYCVILVGYCVILVGYCKINGLYSQKNQRNSFFFRKSSYFCRMEMENDYHRMDRRSKHKRYGLPGTYHVTIQVNRVYRLPLGRVVGRVSEPDGSPDAPRMELSEAGRMV